MLNAGLPVVSLSMKDGKVIDEQYSRELTKEERELATYLIGLDCSKEPTLEEKIAELEQKLSKLEAITKTLEVYNA